MRAWRTMNGVGKWSRPLTDPQRNGTGGGGWGEEKVQGCDNQKSSGR